MGDLAISYKQLGKYLDVVQLAERLPWEQEAVGAGPTIQTKPIDEQDFVLRSVDRRGCRIKLIDG